MVSSLLLQGLLKFPYRPDLILVFILVVAAKRSDRELYGFSFTSALLFDLLYSTSFVSTFTKTLAAWIVAVAKKNVSMDPFRFALVLVGIASPLVVLADAIVYWLFYSTPVDLFRLLAGMAAITVFNLAITPVYCYIFDRSLKESP